MNELIDKLKRAAGKLNELEGNKNIYGKNIIYISKDGARGLSRELGITIDPTKKEQTIGNLTIHIVE